MDHSLWHLSFPWWQFVLRGGIVYLAVLFLIRISGKRQVGQMGTGELVALLLISNSVQNAMNGGDNSVAGGLILAVTLLVITHILALLTFRSSRIERLVEGRPVVLVRQGKIVRKNLHKELLSFPELRSALRRQGVHDLSDVDEALLESNGGITITRKGDAKGLDELGPDKVI